MKRQHLSEKLLNYMVKEYKDHDRVSFQIDIFKALHPEETAESLSKALYLLKNDRLVSIRPYDDLALVTYLLPPAVASIDKPLLSLRKAYEALDN